MHDVAAAAWRVFEDEVVARGVEADILDAACARHPQHADALRSLYADWRAAAGALQPADGHPTLLSRVLDWGGAPSAPNASLPQIDDERPAIAALLGSLAARSAGTQRYRFAGEVGRGGMGIVVRVFDQDLRRPLAMKVFRHAGDPRAVARFVEEAQLTAQLDHPGVVPVHEVGLNARSQPYFTMKLVRGKPLHKVIADLQENREGWTLARAVGVVLKVCEAVAYAHERGVVHRDLKPHNVMVGRFGEVYVMDWGLAKLRTDDAASPATDSIMLGTVRSDEADATPDSPLLTGAGDVVGTPSYMAPEQATAGAATAGRAADVYAIGAILYHVLAGQPPYADRPQALGARELVRLLATTPPTPLAKLAPRTPPELIAICERAMQSELSRRYRSAAALRADLQAWLDGRVVSAFERGAVAELRKWVRRNRLAAAALGAFSIAVVVGGILSTWLWIAADSAHAQAQERAAEAEQTVTFLEDIFEHASPRQSEAGAMPVRDVLAAATNRLRNALAEQPAARARLLGKLGTVHGWIGEYEAAIALLREAIAVDQGRAERRDLAWRWRLALGGCLSNEGHHDEALAELGDLAGELRPTDRRALLGECLGQMAYAYGRQRRFDAATPLAQEAVATLRAVDPSDANIERLARALSNHAGLLTDHGDAKAARPMFRESLALAEKLGPVARPLLADVLHNLGRCETSLGDFDQAIALFERANELAVRLYGADDFEVGRIQAALGVALRNTGHGDRAVSTLRRAVAITEQRPDHPHLAWYLNDLATALDGIGRTTEALPIYERALSLYEASLPDSVDAALCKTNLACSLANGKDPQRAAELAQTAAQRLATSESAVWRALPWRAHAIAEQRLGHADVALASINRGIDLLGAVPANDADRRFIRGDFHRWRSWILANSNDLVGAEQSATTAVAELRAARGGNSIEFCNALFRLGVAAYRQGREVEGIARLEESLATFRRVTPAGCWPMTWTLETLARTRLRAQDASGIGLWRECAAMRQGLAPDEPQTVATIDDLGRALIGLQRFDEAAELLRSAHDDLASRLAAEDLRVARLRTALRALFEAWGKPDEARRWQ